MGALGTPEAVAPRQPPPSPQFCRFIHLLQLILSWELILESRALFSPPLSLQLPGAPLSFHILKRDNVLLESVFWGLIDVCSMLWRENPIKSRCCPQSWPWLRLVLSLANGDGRAGAPLIGCLSGHIICLLSTHVKAITQIGGNRSSNGHFVHCTFFSLGERVFASKHYPSKASLCINYDIFFGNCLFLAPKKKKKASEVKEQRGYNLPLLKEVPLPGHLYVNCMV